MLTSQAASAAFGKVALLAQSRRTPFVLAVGLVDAGFATLAGFLVASYAVLALPPDLLGAYAIYYSAFVLCGFVPAMLYLLPSRVLAVPLTQWNRIGILPSTLRMGALLGCAMAALSPFAGAFAVGEVSLRSLLPLTITSSALIVFSPLQDHVRSLLHLSGRPRRAAVVSVCHFTATASLVAALHFSDIPRTWVPMGALALANLLSLVVAIWLVRNDLQRYWIDMKPTGPVLRIGWSQLLVTTLPIAAQLIVTGIVATSVSLEAVGFLEAARLVGQPVHVAAIGLEQALAPRILEATNSQSKSAIWRARLAYLLPLGVAALAYLALVTWSHPVNPAYHIFPAAYQLTGLVLITVLAVLALDIGTVPRLELTGAMRERSLIGPAVLGAVVQLLLVVHLTSLLGAYVLPLALLAGSGLATLLTFSRAGRAEGPTSQDVTLSGTG